MERKFEPWKTWIGVWKFWCTNFCKGGQFSITSNYHWDEGLVIAYAMLIYMENWNMSSVGRINERKVFKEWKWTTIVYLFYSMESWFPTFKCLEFWIQIL